MGESTCFFPGLTPQWQPSQVLKCSIDWNQAVADLNEFGNAIIGPLLTPEQCLELSSLYDQSELFRSRVVMARHGFGKGEYQYFSYPLPALIQELRTELPLPQGNRILNYCSQAV